MKTSKINPNIDIIRAAACIMVVMLHCSPLVINNKPGCYYSTAVFCFSRACVPLFFIMTGALILPYLDGMGGVKKFYNKRIKRVLYPLLVWGIIYSIIPYFCGLCNLRECIKELLLIPIKQPDIIGGILWYLYVLIGIYLFIPFLSRDLYSKKMRRLYLLFWFLSSMSLSINEYIPTAFSGNLIHPFNMFVQFTGYFGYLILGCELVDDTIQSSLTNFVQKITTSLILRVACFTCLLFLVAVSYKFSFCKNITFLNPIVIIYSGFIYVILFNLKINTNSIIYNIISSIARYSFFIYLAHMMIFTVLTKPFIYGNFEPTVSCQILVEFATFSLSYILALIMSHFKVSKYLGI